MFLPAYIIVFTILQAPTPSVIPPGVHRQAMVTESVKPVPVTVSNLQRTRDNVTKGVAQQGSQSVTVQYVSSTALSARAIPSVQPTGLHVSGVYEAIVNALCALDIYCNVPAPVRPSTSRLVPVHPPSSPVQSAPPQIDSDSSSSGSAPANGRSYSALGCVLGHRFFSKSTLVSSLRALGLDACQLSVFAPWCQIDSRRPSNVRPGPPPNTCTLPELDRCGVGARYLEPIPLHIPYSSPTRLFDLVLVGVLMMVPVLLALGLVFPTPRAILLCPLWWFIEDLTCGVSLLLDALHFTIRPLLFVITALRNGLWFLWGVATRLTQPAPQPPSDEVTAKKYYNDIVVTTSLASPWTQIFEAPMLEAATSSWKNANKSDTYNFKKVDAVPVTPIVSKNASTEPTTAKTTVTTADTESAMSLSNSPAPGPMKPEPNHTEVQVATTMENEKQDKEHQPLSFDSMLTPSVPAPVERNVKTHTHSYIGASTTTSVPALTDPASSNSLRSILAQPTSANTPSPSFVSADYNEGGVEYKYKYKSSGAENDKGYEPDAEDSEDDEDEILETRYYNDEDDGFECGRCYYIRLVIAAHQEIGYNPTAHTESVPSVSILDAVPSSEASYSEPIVNGDASIDNRAVSEGDSFVDTLASRSILASMSSLRGRPEHRRVHSAPTQLALFRSDFVCPTTSTAFVAVDRSIDVTIGDEAHSSDSNIVSSSAAASLCEEVNEDEECTTNSKREAPSNEDQTVNQDVCAETVLAAPLIPDEAATDVLPVADPLPEDSDNGDAESGWDSSDTIVPTTSITSADEDKDDDDKIGDSHTSEGSSDEEEFMERMCNMIGAAVPMVEPVKPTIPEALLDVPSAASTPTSPAPTTGPFAISQETEDKVDLLVEVIVPGIIIVPPTPPASPLPAPNLPLLSRSSIPIISSKTALFAAPSTAFVAAKPSIEVATEDQAYSSDSDIITPSAATSVCEGEKGEESTKDGEREAPADEEQTAGQDVCAATAVVAPLIPDEAATDVLPVADPLPKDSKDGDAESDCDSSNTIVPSASITSADEDKGDEDDEDKLGDSHADEESSDNEEFMDCMSDMIEAAVLTAEPTLTKPTLAGAAFDVPSASSAPAPSTLDTAPPVTPEDSKSEAGSLAEVIIPGIVVVPPSPPASSLPAASLPPPSTTGVAATIPPKVALTPKKKEDIFAALEAEEEEELAQQAKRAPKSAQGRWRGRF